LYGLEKSPRDWYSKLDISLLECDFKIGVLDSNLYVKSNDEKILVVVFYVDVINFSSDLYQLICQFTINVEE